MRSADDEDLHELVRKTSNQYAGDYRQAASIHDELAWQAEQFLEDVESRIMVTGLDDPCSHIPIRTTIDMPEWDIWNAHRRARALWAAIISWNRWQAVNANGPPEFLEADYAVQRIAHIFRFLIERWGWLSIISEPPQPKDEGEPHDEITGRETVSLSELQSLGVACDELRSLIGYNHDPWFRVFPSKAELIAPDGEPSTTTEDPPAALAPSGPSPPPSETMGRHSERTEAARTAKTSGGPEATPRIAPRTGPRKPDKRAIDAYRAVTFGGMKQEEAAKRFKVVQGTISRWVTRVAEWVEAGNILPDLGHDRPKPEIVSMDPRKLEQGPRLR
jgi:hypothetical protein